METKQIIVVEIPDELPDKLNDYAPYQSNYHTQQVYYDDILDDDEEDNELCWLSLDEGEVEVSGQFETKIQEVVYNIVSNYYMNHVSLDTPIDVLTDDWGEQTGILEEAVLMGTQDFHLCGITKPIAENRIRIYAEANATVKGYVVGEIYGCSDEWEGNPEFVYPIGLFVRMDVYATLQLSDDGQDIVEYFDVKTLGSTMQFNLAKPEDDDNQQTFQTFSSDLYSGYYDIDDAGVASSMSIIKTKPFGYNDEVVDIDEIEDSSK